MFRKLKWQIPGEPLAVRYNWCQSPVPGSGSSRQVISSSQRPLPDNTRHSQQTNIHAPGGIRTQNLSRRAAVDLRLRSRGHWDRQHIYGSVCKDCLIGRDIVQFGENLQNIRRYLLSSGHAVAQLVEALRYKLEGRGFDSRWCHWNFSLT